MFLFSVVPFAVFKVPISIFWLTETFCVSFTVFLYSINGDVVEIFLYFLSQVNLFSYLWNIPWVLKVLLKISRNSLMVNFMLNVFELLKVVILSNSFTSYCIMGLKRAFILNTYHLFFRHKTTMHCYQEMRFNPTFHSVKTESGMFRLPKEDKFFFNVFPCLFNILTHSKVYTLNYNFSL